MKKNLLLHATFLICMQVMRAQGICNPAGNLIIYSNYDGGNITINIDENIPDIRIGLCSYEALHVTITGTYAGNVTSVLYAGYNSGGTTSITGVAGGIITILNYPPVTFYDPDGYPYMICAYDCDTAYVPGGCNTVDQATDYFLTELGGNLRYSYLQYGVWSGSYLMSTGGNCCFDAACTAAIVAGQDQTICYGDSVQISALGGDTYVWFPVTGLDHADVANPYANPTTTTNYIVTGTTADGCSGVDSITVFVNPLPVADITVSGTLLTASAGTAYQWYNSGTMIAGATAMTYTVTATGSYSVLITDANGCSAMSETIDFEMNAVNELTHALSIELWPNPAKDVITISLNDSENNYLIYLFNATGEMIKTILLDHIQTATLSLQNVPAGIYHLQILGNEKSGSAEFVIY